jgi:ribonucleotide monophosphatase NagD (HAD superfamily)
MASNPDASYPAPDGSAWPGAGALLAAIETASGTRGEVIGKPHAPIFEDALRRAGGGRPLVVGDRMDTDIAGARRLRWDSMLVLTGISTRDELQVAGFSPTYVADDLRLLVEE